MTKKRVSPVSSVRLDHRGMARFFGNLEARIMEVVWQLEEATVQDVCSYLGGDSNYKTVMTVLNRLVDKGVLERRKEGRAYVYEPHEGRSAFVRRISRAVIEGLLEDFGTLAIAQLVDVVDDVGPEQVAELERLLETRMNRDAQAKATSKDPR